MQIHQLSNASSADLPEKFHDAEIPHGDRSERNEIPAVRLDSGSGLKEKSPAAKIPTPVFAIAVKFSRKRKKTNGTILFMADILIGISE